MTKNDELHPLKRIQRILLDELYQRIFQIEANQKNLEGNLENNSILKERLYRVMQQEIELSGGIGRFLERHHVFEDRYVFQFILKKCLIFSFVFSLIFFLILSVWVMHYLSATVPVPGDSHIPLKPETEAIQQFSRYLTQLPLPVEIRENSDILSVRLNTYHLKDVFEIYYWKQQYGVGNQQIELKLPADFLEYCNLDEKEHFSRYFSYQIDRINRDRSSGSYEVTVSGPTKVWPDELAGIFRQALGEKTQFYYTTLTLSRIYFGIGSAELDTVAVRALDSLAMWMQNLPRLQLIIIGHADRFGLEKVNKEISCRRAEHVERYLMSRHVSGNRIKTECYADLMANETVPARNRNVEFRWMDW